MGKLIIAQSNRGAPDPIGLHNAEGTLINPSTNEKLDELKALLEAIDQNTDELELNTENILIEAEEINLNTDELEAKVQSVRDQLDVLLSSRASESTLLSLLNAVGTASATDLVSQLQDINSELDGIKTSVDLAATEITLASVATKLDDVISELQSLNTKFDVALSTRASEATLQEVKEGIGQGSGTSLLLELQNILSQLDVALSTRASESNLTEAKTKLEEIKTKLDTLNATDFSTETTLSAIQTLISSIDSSINVSLSSRASESTLQEVKETIGQESGNTVLTKLQDLLDKLNSLFTDGLAKTKIWDGTEIANITTDNKLEIVTQGRAKESTLNSTVDQLGSSEIYLGTWEEILDYSHLVVQINTDQDSITDGLEIQWSYDGVNVLDTDNFTLYSGNSKVFTFGCQAKYFRIKYSNGTSITTSFEIHSLLKPFLQKPSSHRILDEISAQDDAELSKSILTGRVIGTESFKNVGVSNEGELETRIVQNVKVSSYNNSTANLAYGASFTGTGETTLGIVGIQINFKSDQMCLIKVQQSIDNINWDIEDSWNTVPDLGDSRTVQATASYFRIIVTNQALDGSSSTTYLRLQVALCPTVEAVPRALTPVGSMKVSLQDPENKDNFAKCDGDNKLFINDGGAVILKTQFTEPVDETKWNLYTAGSGTTTVDTSLNLITTGVSGDVAGILSKLVYEPSTGLLTKFNVDIAYNNADAVNCTRNWGMINSKRTDGIYFLLRDGNLYAVILNNSVATEININVYKPSADTFNHYEIQFSGFRVSYLINNREVYSLNKKGIAPIASANLWKAGASNINSGASTANTLSVFAMSLVEPYARTTMNRDTQGNIGTISPDGYTSSEGHGCVKFKKLFENNTIDTTNVWTETIVGSATKTVSSTILNMTVTTGATDSISYYSIQKLLYSSGRDFSEIDIGVNLGLLTDINNNREFGSRDSSTNSGVYFRYTGTTLYGVCENNTVETKVELPYISDGKTHRFSILKRRITSFYFLIDGVIIGKLFSGTSSIAPLKYDIPYLANYNTALATTGLTLQVESVSVVDKTTQSVSLLGLDPTKLYREVAVDSSGRLLVSIPPSSNNIPIRLRFNKAHSAIASGQWQEVLSYTVPSNHDLNVIAFSGKSAVANEVAAAVSKFAMGSFVGATDTFTDGVAVISPKFVCALYVYVTAQIGSGSNDVITITYTNESGTPGRTGLVTLPKSSPVGTRLEVTLQGSDIGVTDVTNVTHSVSGQVGDFNVEGVLQLFKETMSSTGVQYNSASVTLGGVVLSETEQIYLWYQANSAVSNSRDINLMGSLVPRT